MNKKINIDSLLNSRRLFFKNSLFGTTILIMSGCDFFALVTPKETIVSVQKDLFPFANELNSNFSAYFSTVLNHSKISDTQKTTIIYGVKMLNETSVKEYRQLYIKLSSIQREAVLKKISKEKWGESWIESILAYTMEAVLGDPIYGVNKNEAGWKWLNHTSGLPRPKVAYL